MSLRQTLTVEGYGSNNKNAMTQAVENLLAMTQGDDTWTVTECRFSVHTSSIAGVELVVRCDLHAELTVDIPAIWPGHSL